MDPTLNPLTPCDTMEFTFQNLNKPTPQTFTDTTMSHPIPTTTTTYSPFLNLPPELRQRIYTHLLTTPHPILGPLARGTQTYSLHTSILRVNHQTHTEARPIFFSQNTFVITSLPSSSDPSTTETDTTSGTGAFEPPLQLADLPLVRSLEIDVLFYPKVLRVLEGRKYGGWSPVCEAAERYVGSLVGVLGAVGESLGELRISADTRRYIPAPLGGVLSSSSSSSSSSQVHKSAHGTTHQTQQPEYARGEEHGELDIRKILTGFHMLDRNPRFREALAAITHVPSIFLHFDFAESYFDFEVERGVLCQQRFAELAGQVLVKRNDIRERLAVREAGGDEDGDVDMESEGIMRIESCREVLECVV